MSEAKHTPAPEQHEANKVSLMVLCAIADLDLPIHPTMQRDIQFAIEANRAAIAKATGEQL